MRKSGRRFTAVVLTAVLMAGSVFSEATTVQAEEVSTEETMERLSMETSSAEESSETSESSTEETPESQSATTIEDESVATTETLSEESTESVSETETESESETESETETTEVETETTETEETTEDGIEAYAEDEDVITIAEAKAAAKGTTDLTVKGIVTFVDGKNVYLQDETAGIDAYYNSAPSDIQVGDTLTVKGTKEVYNGLVELKKAETIAVETAEDVTLPCTTLTLQELLDDASAETYESTRVYLEHLTVGTVKTSGSTPVTDADGNSINIYRLPSDAACVEGDTISLYAIVSDFNGYQLRVVSADDITVEAAEPADDSFTVDDSVTFTLASFAGTTAITDTTVYADRFEENDFLDTDNQLTLSNGNVPVVNSNSLGSTGLAEGEYYLLELNSRLCANMELSFMMKGSNTGAKNFVVEYSTDGENYKAAGACNLKASYTTYTNGESVANNVDETKDNGVFSLKTKGKFHEITVTIPEAANNADKLYVRIRVSDSTSINGGEIKSGGTNYINALTVTANPVVTDSACGYVSASPEAGEVGAGSELTLTSATEGAEIYYCFKGESEYQRYDESAKPVLSTLPTAVSVYAVKNGLADSVKITYNYTQESVQPVTVSPNGGAVMLNSKVKMTCETEDAEILYAFVTEEQTEDDYEWQTYTSAVTLSELPCTLAVKATKDGCGESAVKTVEFTQKSNEKYNIYFGQLHSHTSYSDGAGTCEEAFAYAQTVDNLDFLAVTDHSNSFDNADSASITDGSVSTEWTEGKELAKKYTTDDFVALFGYEMTWSNGLGHMNTFNTDGFQSRTQSEYKTYSTALQNYYATLQTVPDSISQFNHPGTTFGDFSDFSYYSEANDALITMIEVGNGEGAIGSSGYFPSYEYYTRALDKGWHVAPTNNQDNHKGKWGSANTARSVVLAEELTEDAIYDAMRNYRIYATEDNDLSIYYTLDSNVMGSTLDADAVGDEVELKVELSDPTDSELGKVEVIVNGGLSIAKETVSTNEETVVFNVPSSYSYYYIKVTEADGDIAVTSPVWVGEVEAAGINEVSTDEALPVAGEALDVTLDLYNNEKNDMTIDSIQFSVDGSVIEDVDLAAAGLTKVESEGTASYTFSYTYDKAGSVEIDVTVKAQLNGSSKVYNGVLQLTYVADSMVAHVTIDGTHYNDYVTGYYGGNMGSFIEICADKNIKAKIVTDEITKEILDETSLLIISAPAKKTGTANAGDYTVSHYEDSFIELVKDYVANGGSVIVCGLADYQDTTSGQTATETNKLLEAIGSTIRMNSDEAYDTENNGGQNYRLYYENVNLDSEYLDGFVEGQTYSAYSGCTVDITGATEETESVYPAEWLVKGFDTTYSIDCKKDDGSKSDSSTYVEKGNVVALASQKTKFGGEIFVAGSVFMSDFEVDAEIDNNDSLQYANYTIINNILESKKVELEATDIATVRQGEMGDVFAIEGYVANGTDNENTTFFDTIYVQDETGGITVFPFATSGLKVGTKIRVVGYVDAYQGDKELQLVSYSILDDENLADVTPTVLSVKDSMDYDNYGGSLIQVTGKVSKVEKDGDVVSEFWLSDGEGNEAAIFIDGYITSATTGENTLGTFVEEGATVTAVGFLYKHPEGDSDVSVPVLRVRNCDEITLESAKTDDTDSNSGSSDNTSSSSTTDSSSSSSSTSTSSTTTSTSTTTTTTTTAITTIEQQLIPLSESALENGIPYENVSLAESDGRLRTALLEKYYGRNLYVMAHLGNGVGFSVLGTDITDTTTEYDLSSTLQQLPDVENAFYVYYLKASQPLKLPFMTGVHINLGAQYTGSTAYIYSKSLTTGEFTYVKTMTVNEIGNVATVTNEWTDLIVLIAR